MLQCRGIENFIVATCYVCRIRPSWDLLGTMAHQLCYIFEILGKATH